MLTRLRIILKANYQQLLLVFLAFFAMVLVTYTYVGQLVRQQMAALGEEVMNTTQTAVTGSLSETELIFANAVQTVQRYIQEGRGNDEILSYLVGTNDYFGDARSALPQHLSLYGYIRGAFLDGTHWTPPPDYEVERRPWFVGAVDNGGAVFTSDPYVDADTGGVCVSFSQTLRGPNGELAGVLAIDLNLSRVTDYVSAQKIAGGGYGVLISDRLTVTTHPNDAFIGRDLGSISTDYGWLAQALSSGERISARWLRDYEGTGSVAFFRQVFNGWYIGIIIPQSSYFAPLYSLGAVISLLGLALAALLGVIQVRSRMAKLKADAESASKSSFLARMSHEMRTPMNAILGMTEIARGSMDMAQVRYSLDQIYAAARHLLGVINDVLDMSKIGAGKLELSPTPLELRPMLDQTAGLMSFSFKEKGQQYTVDVGADVPLGLVADRQRLAQVITNLLSNACKFTPQGGAISLSVGCLQRDAEACTLSFAVRDTGIGMTEEHMSRLFHSFEQADNSISRKFGGTGLGLAISKSIVEMMGGAFSVTSQPGQGSVFAFTIRADVCDLTPGTDQPAPLPDLTGLFAGKAILLAEDVAINREIVATLLLDTQVEIDWAENGRRALDMYAAQPERYDMIFMDIHMPEMDGYEAARAIRALEAPRARTVPIVAMTADVFREDVERADAAGMNGHVGKPIDMVEVIATMAEHLLARHRV